MDRQATIKETIENISKLPDYRIKEVSDYVDFLLKKSEDKNLVEGIKKAISKSKSFSFLKEEEELYSDSDIIQKYR